MAILTLNREQNKLGGKKETPSVSFLPDFLFQVSFMVKAISCVILYLRTPRQLLVTSSLLCSRYMRLVIYIYIVVVVVESYTTAVAAYFIRQTSLLPGSPCFFSRECFGNDAPDFFFFSLILKWNPNCFGFHGVRSRFVKSVIIPNADRFCFPFTGLSRVLVRRSKTQLVSPISLPYLGKLIYKRNKIKVAIFKGARRWRMETWLSLVRKMKGHKSTTTDEIPAEGITRA